MERIITTYKFNDRNLAFGFALHGIKPMAVILGDDDRFWVCSLADAERLYRQGYEYAN